MAEKIGGMFGWAVDKRTIWRAAQKTAPEIDFKLDAKELPQGEADGTGIDIKGIAKRGKELKVFVQYKHGGDARVAGLDLGNYNGSWNKLFQNSLEVFKGFSELLLPTDGDTSILDGLKDKVRQDNLPALFMAHPASSKICFMAGCCKVQEYGVAICNCRADGDMCDIQPFVDYQQTIEIMIEAKKKRLEEVIRNCRKNEYSRTVSYLENA